MIKGEKEKRKKEQKVKMKKKTKVQKYKRTKYFSKISMKCCVAS